MSTLRRSMACAAAAATLTACAEDVGTGLPSADARSAAAHGAGVPWTLQVGGAWEWENVEALAFPAFLAPLLGILPEGPLTHARCASTGVLTLEQEGATFHGVANRVTNSCATNGGQLFQQPSGAFVISDGRVRGLSASFSFAAVPVGPCPHHVVATATDGAEAVALSGGGRCFLPGHPRADAPFSPDPPNPGFSKTLSWDATR